MEKTDIDYGELKTQLVQKSFTALVPTVSLGAGQNKTRCDLLCCVHHRHGDVACGCAPGNNYSHPGKGPSIRLRQGLAIVDRRPNVAYYLFLCGPKAKNGFIFFNS